MSAGESESESENELIEQETTESPETVYTLMPEEEFGTVKKNLNFFVYLNHFYILKAGEQVEELAEEHKSLLWILVKQVRPGMDLSKVNNIIKF